MVNSYRFLNSEIFYSENSLPMLIRVLSPNTCEDREKWWLEIRACRRRKQIPLEPSIAVNTAFTNPTEYSIMEFHASVDRIKLGLKERGMLVFDAFKAFNSSNSGLLTCSELYGSIEFLGIKFTPDQVHNLMRKIAISNEGLASYEDFKKVFHGGEDEFESMAIAATGDNNFEIVPPKPIQELVDITKRNDDDLPIVLNSNILKFFKVKTKPIKSSSSYLLVWNSQGTQSQQQVAVWAPSLTISILTMTKIKLCLGHYATRGFSNPAGTKEGKNHQLIEISDNATIRMNRGKVFQTILRDVFPLPLRFKRLWQISRGDKTFVAWKPIPPDGFACLGIVTTSVDEEPKNNSIRCVPLPWVKPSKVVPTKIWDDSGAGGGKPGSIWIINSYDMITVVAGHEPPRGEEFYDFVSSRFFMDQITFKLVNGSNSK